MSDECTHDCSTCTSDCSGTSQPAKEPLNENSAVEKVYAVVGGKGGVGKTTVAALLASAVQKKGRQAAVLDADITGPSVPFAFGINTRATVDDIGMFPVETDSGIQIISVNTMIPNPNDPVLARGALVENTIKKFWSDVIWEDVDYMFIDMPTGTGEIPIAVLRHLPVDGVIIVTTPQELAAMITGKTVKMARALGVPVVGVVENMAYFSCADCGRKHYIFGEEKAEEYCVSIGVENWSVLPVDPELSKLCDEGRIEEYATSSLENILKAL